MEKRLTNYGILDGVICSALYKNGILKECVLNKHNEIKTEYGLLIPQYDDSNPRCKYTNSLSFYENGMLKSISLQEQTNIMTPIGVVPAELVTFYETGEIKRVFPLNGKITGYWTEENEFALAYNFKYTFSFGTIHEKIISILFYKSGAIKSITFWPNIPVSIKSPIGDVQTRSGISLYPNGTLESFEPFEPMVVKTPIGSVNAYDIDAIGIHGDSNSFHFNTNGDLQSIITTTDCFEVVDSQGVLTVHEPESKPSLLNNGGMDIIPIKITFTDNKVIFHDNNKSYDLATHSFRVISKMRPINNLCGDCSKCAGCNIG